MEDNCIFCKIIKGEIPSYTIYEDDYFKAILDRFPSTKGHTVIIPKKHFENIISLDSEYSSRVLEVAKIVIERIDKVIKADGYNILQNNGVAAGQTVMHYHMHVVPRFEKDDIKIGWHQLELTDEEMLETYNEIMK